jgi:CRISPR system Cascade subunit CasA
MADEDTWRGQLLALSDGEPTAWCLLVEDLSKPALLQPPVPEGTLKAYTKKIPVPDELDILVTSKNHDVKRQCVRHARPEHWLYALLTGQTFGGYQGPGIYPIARMNGGYGSRPCVGLAPSQGNLSGRWRRDVVVLQDARKDIVSEHGYTAGNGLSLLWLPPWDGTTSVSLQQCDPYFIDCARRIRLTQQEDMICAHRASASSQRVDAKALNGITGDPWTPISIKDNKSLSVADSGFHYAKIDEFLFNPDWQLGVAARSHTDDPEETELVLQCLVRGQGGTSGYHERCIPTPKVILDMFTMPSARDKLTELSKFQISVAERARRKVLHPAMCSLLQAAPESLSLKDSRDQRVLAELESLIDADFFPYLWAGAMQDDELAAQDNWTRFIRKHVETVFQRALDTVPIPSARRHRTIAKADLLFRACRNKHLPLNTP